MHHLHSTHSAFSLVLFTKVLYALGFTLFCLCDPSLTMEFPGYHNKTMSYCSGDIEDSARKEMGLPMKSLKPAK